MSTINRSGIDGLHSTLQYSESNEQVGFIASIFGILLTSVLIITHWRNGLAEYKKTKLETQIMRRKEQERIDKI